jgi:hypothetical protein
MGALVEALGDIATSQEAGRPVQVALSIEGKYLTDSSSSLHSCGIRTDCVLCVESDSCAVNVEGVWGPGRIEVALSSQLGDLYSYFAEECGKSNGHLALSVDGVEPVEWASSLRECGCRENTVIQVSVCEQIDVKVTGPLLSEALRLDPSASIGDLRESLAEMSGVAPVDLVLLVHGRVRSGQHVSLRASGIVAGSEIVLETAASLLERYIQSSMCA